ncbi:MAG TPA: response regulator, partial [Leptospiraceae bacterium]|nr:response regulator [Leptospiraceae bacterium]
MDEEQKRPRIVLVEDDLVQREMIAQMLIFAGYDVTSAATGEEGQELIESVKPDAAVVDLHLPAERGVTGLVLL